MKRGFRRLLASFVPVFACVVMLGAHSVHAASAPGTFANLSVLSIGKATFLAGSTSVPSLVRTTPPIDGCAYGLLIVKDDAPSVPLLQSLTTAYDSKMKVNITVAVESAQTCVVTAVTTASAQTGTTVQSLTNPTPLDGYNNRFATSNKSAFRDFNQGKFDESIDPVTGRLTLIYNDVVVPGPNGLDIKVVRSYHAPDQTQVVSDLIESLEPKFNGLGWNVHVNFGGVRGLPVNTTCLPDPAMTLNGGGQYWSIENLPNWITAEGRALPMMPVANSNGSGPCYWTASNGVRIGSYTSNAGAYPYAELPNGTRIDLGLSSTQWTQSIPGTESGQRNNFLPTKITDRWGNWIAFEYLTAYTELAYGVGSLMAANNSGNIPITRITASDGRVVNFTYGSTAPGWASGQALPLADFALKQIDYGGYSVKYNYSRLELTGVFGTTIPSPTVGKYFLANVDRPDGKRWGYEHDISGPIGTNPFVWVPATAQYLLKTITFPQGGTTTYTWGLSQRTTPSIGSRPQRPLSTQVRQKLSSDGGAWRYAYTDSVRSASNPDDDIPDPVTGLYIAVPPEPFDPSNPPLPAFEGSRITGPSNIELAYHAPRYFAITCGNCEVPRASGGPIPALGLIRQHAVFALGTSFRSAATAVEKTVYTHESTYVSSVDLRQGFPSANDLLDPPLETQSSNYHSRLLTKSISRGTRTYTRTNATFNLGCSEAQGGTEIGERVRQTALTFGAFCQVVGETLYEGSGTSAPRKKRIVRNLTANQKNIQSEFWFGPTDSDGGFALNQYTYHATGDVASHTDAVGSTTRYNNYTRGTAQEELHPTVRGGDANSEPATTRIRTVRVVDDLGRITSETDGEGRKVDYSYNGEHKPLSITLARDTVARVINFTYNGNNDVMTQGARTEQVNYDGLGRVTSYHNGIFSTGYGYDAAGRRNFVSYPGKTEGQGVTFDALNRPLTLTEPNPTGTGTGQAVTEVTYQDNEHAVTVKNARNYTTKTSYESMADPSDGWIKSQVLADNVGTLRYDRNIFGQPEMIAYTNALDASQNVTRTMAYDAANQYHFYLQSHPELGDKYHVRDNNGNVTGTVVARGNVTTGVTGYQYDGQNRLIAVTPPAGDITPGVARTWYRSGKPKTIVAGNVTRSYQFDGNDNLSSETVTIDGVARTLGYEYDALDHLNRMTYPSGDTVDYAPDVLGRPTQATPFVTSMAHHPSGLASTLTYANGLVQNFDEQATRALPSALAVRRTATNASMLSLGFGYDSVANLTTMTDGLGLGYARNNGFDGFDRITSATYPTTPAANENFTFKGIGDFDTKSGNGTAQSYSIDATTRRLSTIVSANPSYARSYSYDGYGNASGDGRFNYSFDAYSTLRQSRQLNGSVIADYVYDGLNQLAKKTSTPPPNGNPNLQTVNYLYSATGKLFGEYPANATTTGKEFIYASGKMVGQSVRGGSSANAISINGTGPLNPAWYLGKVQDTTTGLVYFGARWFDPITARFTGFDPADVTDDNPHSFNRYAYGNNNPYKYLDPDGRVAFLALIPLAVEAAPAIAAGGAAIGVMAARAAPFAQRALSAMMGTVNTLATQSSNVAAVAETAAGIATGTPMGASAVVGAPAVGAAVAGIWSSTKSMSATANAFQHYSSHGAEFGAKNALEYAKMAKDFMHNSPLGTLSKTRSNGDVVKYNPQTNTFGVMDKGGAPRTLFKPSTEQHGKPTNTDYFNAQ